MSGEERVYDKEKIMVEIPLGGIESYSQNKGPTVSMSRNEINFPTHGYSHSCIYNCTLIISIEFSTLT